MVPTIDASWTVFVDRDGVINRRMVGDYVRSVEQFEFLPGAIDALRLLGERSGHVVVVSNQQGIGKGLYNEDDLALVHHYMTNEIRRSGGRIDAVLHCPHVIGDQCGCRKPAPGMAHRAVEDIPDISLSRSVMIGDSSGDVGFARAAGMAVVLVTGTGGDGTSADAPDAEVETLWHAALLLTAPPGAA